jgi:hypothetical protein
MKNATARVARQSNSEAVGHKSQIDPEAMGIVMEILSKMYTNGPRAVLREYACNGHDSHVEAGTDRPVEVTLPNGVNPSLLIRDYGTGLTADEIISVFGTYGRSTKRDTNDQVGAFGIGSKSALVLVNSFIVTGYKSAQWIVTRDGEFDSAYASEEEALDCIFNVLAEAGEDEVLPKYHHEQGSVRTVVEFGLDENNVLTGWVQRQGKTEEPNGVLIVLVPPDADVMRAEARSFFSTWEKGSVLVDGQEPESVYDSGTALSENIHVLPDHNGEVNVVMGNVAYPASRDLLGKVAQALVETPAHKQALALVDWSHSTTTSIYFKVPIGAVDIAPTREGLRDTSMTVKALAALVSEMVEQVSTKVRQSVESSSCAYQAALRLEHEVENLGAFKVSRKDFSFEKMKISGDVKTKDLVAVWVHTGWQWGRRGGRNVVEVTTTLRPDKTVEEHVVDPKRAPKTVVVVVPKMDDVTKVKRYAKRFLEENEQGWDWILVTDQAHGAFGWFQWGIPDGASTLSLDEYRVILRSLRDSSPRTANEPSYSVGWGAQASRDLNDRDVLTDILSWGKPLVLFHGNAPRLPHEDLYDVVRDAYTPVVLLGTQSEAALRKRVEADGSVEFVDYADVKAEVTAKAQEVFDSLTDEERMTLAASSWLVDNDYGIREWRGTYENLRRDDEEYTHPVFEDVLETVALVRLEKESMTEDRKSTLRVAASWLGKDLVKEAVDSGVLPALPDRDTTLPLLGAVSAYSIRQDKAVRADVKRYLALYA